MLSWITFAYYAQSNLTQIPVAHDNALLIALSLKCFISPCQADNLSSHDVDMLMVTTTIQYNGSFGSHHFPSTEIKCFSRAVKFIFLRLVEKKTGILCVMLPEFWGGYGLELNIKFVFEPSRCACVQELLLYSACCVSNLGILYFLHYKGNDITFIMHFQTTDYTSYNELLNSAEYSNLLHMNFLVTF